MTVQVMTVQVMTVQVMTVRVVIRLAASGLRPASGFGVERADPGRPEAS